MKGTDEIIPFMLRLMLTFLIFGMMTGTSLDGQVGTTVATHGSHEVNWNKLSTGQRRIIPVVLGFEIFEFAAQ